MPALMSYEVRARRRRGKDLKVCKVLSCTAATDPCFDVTMLCTWHAECVPAAMWLEMDACKHIADFVRLNDAIIDYANDADDVINGEL
jgi:hypothetical protein